MEATSISSSRPDSVPLRDPVAEARRLVEAANRLGVVARVLGGAAVYLQAPAEGPLLPRPIKDIDVATHRGARTAVTQVLIAAGYAPDRMFNALHGAGRLLFYDEVNARKLDVFIGDFSMCHQIPIADRLEREPLTLPLAELLLTKLQIVKLTERIARAYPDAMIDAIDVGPSPGELLQRGVCRCLVRQVRTHRHRGRADGIGKGGRKRRRQKRPAAHLLSRRHRP